MTSCSFAAMVAVVVVVAISLAAVTEANTTSELDSKYKIHFYNHLTQLVGDLLSLPSSSSSLAKSFRSMRFSENRRGSLLPFPSLQSH